MATHSIHDNLLADDPYAGYEARPLMVWRGRTVVHGRVDLNYRHNWKLWLHGSMYGMGARFLVGYPHAVPLYETPLRGGPRLALDIETPLFGRTLPVDNLINQG